MEFVSECVGRGDLGLAFDNDCRLLIGPLSQANKCAPVNRRMLVDDCLAGHTEKCTFCGFNPMGLSTAKPKTVHLVDVADVSHAVPDRVVIIHLGHGGGAIVVEITFGDRGATDNDLTDLSIGQEFEIIEPGNRIVVYLGNAHINIGEKGPDTGAGPVS